MTVVVTGAAGFIGRHVVRTLRRRGLAVVGVDRRPWRPQQGEQALLSELSVPDLRVDAALRDATGVIHLAGRPGVRGEDGEIQRQRWRDNVVAGERVLAATPADVPVVVASSSSVYGGAGAPGAARACREDDVLAPSGGYARSKAALEERCAQRAERGGLVGVARPFTVAGAGQRPDMAISRWISAMRAGLPVTLLGSGDRRRDVTGVRDVAEGLVRMLERRLTATVNLGTGTTRRLDELIAAVAAACAATPRIELRPASAAEVAATRAHTGRCAALLGFVPVTDLRTLVAWQLDVADHETTSRRTTRAAPPVRSAIPATAV